MGYSFYIFDRNRPITEQDGNTATENLLPFNRGKGNFLDRLICDITYSPKYITVSGSFGISGKYVEGFVLNLVIDLIDLGYTPKVISRDWGYGSEEDWKWLEGK